MVEAPSTGRRRLVLVAALATAVLIAYVASQNLTDAAVYYLTPTEAHDRHVGAGQTARLGGRVLAGTLRYDPASRDLRFTIGDGITTVQVIGNGAPPGLLREGAGAVVEGMFSVDGSFRATQVLAKHDEIYAPPSGSATPSHRRP
jgi:cytochrome c-type biogenesis protein CcmE